MHRQHNHEGTIDGKVATWIESFSFFSLRSYPFLRFTCAGLTGAITNSSGKDMFPVCISQFSSAERNPIYLSLIDVVLS